jgi:hypothetical protein
MKPLTKLGGYEARKRNMLPTSTNGLPLNANSQSSTAEIDHRPPRPSTRRFLPLNSECTSCRAEAVLAAAEVSGC